MNPNPSTPSPAPGNPDVVIPSGRAFLFISLLTLVLGMGMLVGQSAFLLTSTLSDYGKAWLDLMIYGCTFSAVFGLFYQAIPRIFGIPSPGRTVTNIHLCLHLVGLGLLLAGRFGGSATLLQSGTILIALGAILFIAASARSLNHISKADAATAFLATTMLWLLLLVALGNPFPAQAPWDIFKTQGWHAGWLVLALCGVGINAAFGITLGTTPLALNTAASGAAATWYAFILTNLGLAWLSTAMALAPLPAIIVCAGIYLLGSFAFLITLNGLIRAGSPRTLSWEIKFLVLSTSMICVSVGILAYSAWQKMAATALAATQAAADGGLAPAETGTTGEGPMPLEFLPADAAALLTILLAVAIPALIALIFQVQSLENASQDNPSLRIHLGAQILLASFFNYAVGVMMVIPAAWAEIPRIVELGTLFLLVSAAGFLGNYLFLGRLTSPTKQNMAPSRATTA